jgi:hypothetical protein
MTARSKGPCTSAADARRQATDAAIAELERLVIHEIDLPTALAHGWDPREDRGAKRLREIVETDFRLEAYIADRFVQRFQRPYGELWQEAILFSAPKPYIENLANTYVREARSHLTMSMRKGLSVAGLVVLILALYGFLNAATKGYYAWSLRVATVLLVVGGLVVLLAFVA